MIRAPLLLALLLATAPAFAQGVSAVSSAADGVPGPAGALGQQGAKGDAGPAGTQGAKGDQGSQGVSGQQGAPGAAGPAGPGGQAGAKGDQGPAGSQGATGLTGAAGTPRRVERYTAATDSSGIASFTWSSCTAAPDVQVIPSWVGTQSVGGGVTAQSLTGATVQAMISRATLLLSAGPFQAAPAGTSITVRVICN